MTVATSPDPDACAREPVHIPGAIQPYGTLLVIEPKDFTIVQAAANHEEILGTDGLLGSALEELPAIGSQLTSQLRRWLERKENLFVSTLRHADRPFYVTGHAGPQGVLLEFEQLSSIEDGKDAGPYPRFACLLNMLEPLQDIAEIGAVATAELRQLTGFDRALLYRFDAEWNGTVIAESRNDKLPSYLDLRFPAADIPPQVRDLYRRNHLRFIPDGTAPPAAIHPPLSPIDGAPLDLSLTTLRSVSPVHLDYMRNMQTPASMSIALLVDDVLWGLISCHHATPMHLSPAIRAASELFGQMVAYQIGASERIAASSERLARQRIETELLARIARESGFEAGLVANADLWLRLVDAEGAAIVSEDDAITVGNTPPVPAIMQLADRLRRQDAQDLVATAHLASWAPELADIADTASGLLAIPVSRIHASYLMWFRPEMVRTVTWGGEPGKQSGADDRLHPRASFAKWTEQVRQHSRPWRRTEIETVQSFRGAIVEFVLKRAEERALLTAELERSNRELESFSYSISHDLRAPFRHIVGYADLLREREPTLDEISRHYLNTISEAAMSASQLVDDLLSFSQLGRASLTVVPVDMQKLVSEVRRALENDVQGRDIEWDIGPLPTALGDASLVRQAVHNLIENALKYTRRRQPARISVQGREEEGATIYVIRDNGVGFDMRYVAKLFGVFQRLHRAEDFEGTGIGLALTKRVIDRHGGWIRAEGTLDKGATFTFALPKKQDAR